MSSLVEDLLELQSHLQAVALIEGDVVTCDDAARLMAANVLITKDMQRAKADWPRRARRAADKLAVANWNYCQQTGAMTAPDGIIIAYGYAGHPPFVNRPAADPLSDLGPLPTGKYTISAAYDHPTCGPCSMPLEPDPGNNMHGRSEFLIHGDDSSPVGRTASAGCIILPRDIRDTINASTIRDLVVTP